MSRTLREKTDEILALEGRRGRAARVRFYLAMGKRYLLERIAFFSPSNRIRVWCFRSMGIRIGVGVFIGNYVTFDRIFPGRIEVRDHASIGDRCLITAHTNIPSETPLKVLYPRTVRETVVGRGAWIMPNCTIAPGVRVGDHAVVATGAVVTRDVPPRTLAAGVPAKVVKNLEVDDGAGPPGPHGEAR